MNRPAGGRADAEALVVSARSAGLSAAVELIRARREERPIAGALPAMDPPHPLRLPVALAAGLCVRRDHRGSPT